MSLLESPEVRVMLQSAGEALLVAAASGTEVVGDVVVRLARDLEERAWPGDAELAQLLRAEPLGAAPGRRRVAVDLDEVADLLQGDTELSYGGYVDLESGQTWPSSVFDALDDEVPDLEADPDRYLFVPNEGSREAWEDMNDFAQTVSDAAAREQLLDAITGRGAFSRFRRVLDRHEDLLSSWRIFETERRLSRARAWLADAGFAAVPPGATARLT